MCVGLKGYLILFLVRVYLDHLGGEAHVRHDETLCRSISVQRELAVHVGDGTALPLGQLDGGTGQFLAVLVHDDAPYLVLRKGGSGKQQG